MLALAVGPLHQPTAELGTRAGRRHGRPPGLTLLIAQPDDQALDTAGWVWPAGGARARRVDGRPAPSQPCAAESDGCSTRSSPSLAIGSVGAMYETAVTARTSDSYAGARHAVRRRRSPTAPGLHGDRQPDRRARERARRGVGRLGSDHRSSVSRTTRVCAYDRAGQGWSDDVDAPQDGGGHRRRSAHPARACRRIGPLRARRPLRRRPVRR